MENQILNLESATERATTISLDMLSQSIRQEGKYGDALSTKPVQIWNLVSDVQEMLDKSNINGSLGDIYIQKRSSAALLNDFDRNAGYNKFNAPINRWKFEKAITSINVPNISNAGTNAKIGITLNEQGLSVAYGMNVHVCSNFSVMGGTLLRTYTFNKQPGLEWSHMKRLLSDWTSRLDQIFGVQSEIMHNMIEKEVKDERTVNKIVGTLYQDAIRQAYFNGDHTPFDTHALSQFVQEMIKQRKEEEKIGNVWDLYNWGTSVMKPNVVDIADISNISSSYADFLCKEFTIDIPTIEV